MKKEYILINDSEQGKIALSKDVIESIVRISLDEIEDVEPLIKTAFNNPIKILINKNRLIVNVNVGIKDSENLNTITRKLQSKIFDSIYQMTAIKTKEINITVNNFVN